MANKTETAQVDVIINGEKANATLNEMRSTVRQLNAEMAKIPDPLNSAEFKRGQQAVDDLKGKIKEIAGNVKQAGSAWEDMLKIAGGVSMADLARKGLGLLKQGFTEVIASTRGTADQWATMVDGMKAGYNEFLKSIATGSWDNFFTNIKNAIAAGREFSDTMANLEQRVGAQAILSAESREKFTDLWNQFNDQTQPFNDRIKAGNDAIKIESDAANANKINNNIALAAKTKELESVTKLGAATMENYVRNYQQNQSLIDQARSYISLQKQLEDAKSAELSGDNSISSKGIQDQIDKTSQAVKNYSAIVEGMDKLSKTEYKDFVDLWVKKLDVQTGYNEEVKRLIYQVSGAEKLEKQKGISEAEKANKDAEKELKKHNDNLLKLTYDLADATAQAIKDDKQRALAVETANYLKEVLELKRTSDGKKDTEDVLNKVLEVKKEEHFRRMLTIEEEYDKKSKTISTSLGDIPKKLERVDTSESDAANRQSDQRLQKRQHDELEATKLHLENLGQFNLAEQKKFLDLEEAAEIAAAGKSGEAVDVIKEKYIKKNRELEKQNLLNIINDIKTVAGSIDQILDASNNTKAEQDQEYLDKFEVNTNKQKKLIDDQLKDHVINQQVHDEAIANLDRKLSNEKKRLAIEQAERDLKTTEEKVLLQEAIAIAEAIVLAITSSSTWVEAIIAIGAALITVVAEFSTASDKLNAAKSAQYAKGRYNVIGADDGRPYNDVSYLGSPKTGEYTKPALIADHGKEWIVDYPTVRNIEINYPWIKDAISFARVPQHASGVFPSTPNNSMPPSQQIIVMDPGLKNAIEKFNDMASKGIIAKISYDYDTQERAKITASQNDVSK